MSPCPARDCTWLGVPDDSARETQRGGWGQDSGGHMVRGQVQAEGAAGEAVSGLQRRPDPAADALAPMTQRG